MRSVILLVLKSLEVGGTERHIVEILRLLKRQGWQMRVYVLERVGSGVQEIEQLGIKVEGPHDKRTYRYVPHFLKSRLETLLSIAKLIRVLFSSDIKIVHFFLPKAYLIGGMMSLFAPIPLRVMSRRSLNYYQLKHPWLAAVERKLHGSMDAILSNSLSVKANLLQEGVDRKKIGLIYNGFDMGRLKNVSDRNTTRARLKVKSDSLILIIVATLFPYKGHMDLVRALAGISKQMPEGWKLLIVGRDEGELVKLRAAITRCNIFQNIMFLGERLDAFDLIAASDIGLICSHEEGFSNAVIEYMANGLPVIATDAGGNSEAVLNNKTGLVVPPKSPIDLGQAILNLACDKHARQKMGKAGKLRLKKQFALELCVEKYSNFYKNISKANGKSVQEIIDSQ